MLMLTRTVYLNVIYLEMFSTADVSRATNKAQGENTAGKQFLDADVGRTVIKKCQPSPERKCRIRRTVLDSRCWPGHKQGTEGEDTAGKQFLDSDVEPPFFYLTF